MQLVDDKAIARGMIRVSPGEDLVESLKALAEAAGWQEAFVTGAGVLELVELRRGDGSVTLENAEITSLAGRLVREKDGVAVTLRAVVIAGGELVSGKIEAAMTGAIIMVVDAVTSASRVAEPLRSVAKANQVAPADRVAPAERAAPAAAATPPPARPSSSALKPPSQHFSSRPIARPMTSAPDRDDEDDAENPAVDVGDILVHPQLGRCEVVGDDTSGGTQVRLSSGKVRVLRLDALQVLAGEEDDSGRMTFKVAGPRRRTSRF